MVVLPYIQGTIYKISKVLRRKNFNTSFRPLNSLRNLLEKSKDTTDPRQKKVSTQFPILVEVCTLVKYA